MPIKLPFLWVLCVIFSSTIYAQSDTISIEKIFSGFGAVADQDAFFRAKNEDRDYSFGAGFNFGGAWVNHKYNPFSYPLNLVNKLPQILFDKDKSGRTLHYFNLVMKGYTPDSLSSTVIEYGDRPYAGIVFLNFGKRTIREDDRLFFNSDFRIGFLGTYLPQELQRTTHDIARGDGDLPKDPKGWHNQISHGGEITGLLRYQIGYLPWKLSSDHIFQYIPKFEINLGYYTAIGASLGFKFGKISSSWWGFESDYMEYGDVLNRDYKHWFESYVYLKTKYDYVIYDAMLQGQFRESVYTLNSNQLVRNVAQFETGYMLRLGLYETWIGLTMRTTNFSLQNRNHYWVNFGGSFMF
ncbi:MAG: lipid A-modifier LpxR family protein [Salibacteraceae bacterium]